MDTTDKVQTTSSHVAHIHPGIHRNRMCDQNPDSQCSQNMRDKWIDLRTVEKCHHHTGNKNWTHSGWKSVRSDTRNMLTKGRKRTNQLRKNHRIGYR